jgi:hypothetical protein
MEPGYPMPPLSVLYAPLAILTGIPSFLYGNVLTGIYNLAKMAKQKISHRGTERDKR